MEFEHDPTTQNIEKQSLTKLAKLVEKYNIPTDNNMGKWAMDKRYVAYHTTDDYELINTAIHNIIESDRLHEIPPPIIAIRKTAYGAPAIFFIRTNAFKSKNRKQKIIKPKSKRNIIKKCKCK